MELYTVYLAVYEKPYQMMNVRVADSYGAHVDLSLIFKKGWLPWLVGKMINAFTLMKAGRTSRKLIS